MIAPGSLSRASLECGWASNTEMKRGKYIILAFIVVPLLTVSANPPQLRLSWNTSHKADLQTGEGVMEPQIVRVINEQGSVLLNHRYTEFSEGKVTFEDLPAGIYQLVIADEKGNQIRAERFPFDPDSTTGVTSVNLQLLPTGTFGDRTANPANTAGKIVSPFNPNQ